ncbi:MAG: N-acetyltransferase [Alphaproteobacteria bacterium]|nr:MAG: N-acetyltransferase [Alphaproteobacteria bacterium]
MNSTATTMMLPISTARLTVRAFRPDDASAFHSWRDDAQVARYTLWDYPYPLERAQAFCERMAVAEPFPMGGWYQLFVEERSTGQAVGDIGIGRGVHDRPDTIYIGYSLRRNAWGKGYMTEALRALLPALAAAFPPRYFAAEIDARNPASGRVLERLGFVLQPSERQVYVKGEWCDELDYSLDAGNLDGNQHFQ